MEETFMEDEREEDVESQSGDKNVTGERVREKPLVWFQLGSVKHIELFW